MARTMTVDAFRQMIANMAQARMGLRAYCDYLKHRTREDKYLREEYLPILAVINHKSIPESEQIELGNETEGWDARISATELFEVVQALPEDEYQTRREIASGGASITTYIKHAADHHQFPDAVVDAIKSKHKKGYTDSRSLVVVFSGDYSSEQDDIVNGWVQELRRRTTRGSFKDILLVELDRLKVFSLFESIE